jgi:hypothetical protein
MEISQWNPSVQLIYANLNNYKLWKPLEGISKRTKQESKKMMELILVRKK